MAFMTQDKKATIAAELKKVVPAGWKYSLRVIDHSLICMTVSQAPVDLRAYESINTDADRARNMPDVHKTVEAIRAALNTGNYSRSDILHDYHDVGHYIDLRFGSYKKPFKCTGAA